MEITGKIIRIHEEKSFGTNGFRKRTTHIETDEQYPQTIEVEFVQDKVELLDKFQPGQTVKISINLRGREWVNPEGEVVIFNTIQGWAIIQVN